MSNRTLKGVVLMITMLISISHIDIGEYKQTFKYLETSQRFGGKSEEEKNWFEEPTFSNSATWLPCLIQSSIGWGSRSRNSKVITLHGVYSSSLHLTRSLSSSN